MISENIKVEFERETLPHMNSLYQYAMRLCRNSDDAEDLVQDTYLKAFRFFDKFERGTNCKAWLFRILKNSFINKYRSDKREPDVVDYSDVEEFYEQIKSTYTDTSNLEHTLFSAMLEDEVDAALNSLSDEFRSVIQLCDIEEFSYEDIADILQIPIGTVRSRIHRARNILAAKLYLYAQKRGYTNN
ncbi:MAG: sigma-70 family RNA polymerase sigma factor [Candidatus Kapaibacterium sp.]|nr:sigma-70 family RNA polymerase sigma factor [Bacteroidota bacterium]